MTKRRILKLSGNDVSDFLQGLVTNDIAGLDEGLVYAALLTPQGKYIADFFLCNADDGVLLDVAESHADTVTTRLNMYKLRADVSIADSGLFAHRGLGTRPRTVLPIQETRKWVGAPIATPPRSTTRSTGRPCALRTRFRKLVSN